MDEFVPWPVALAVRAAQEAQLAARLAGEVVPHFRRADFLGEPSPAADQSPTGADSRLT